MEAPVVTSRLAGRSSLDASAHGVPRHAGRVAIIGDIGGHIDVFIQALEFAGVETARCLIPDDLTVVQVGDLVHKGPSDDACVNFADRLLRGNPGRYIQVIGAFETTKPTASAVFSSESITVGEEYVFYSGGLTSGEGLGGIFSGGDTAGATQLSSAVAGIR